MVRDSAPNKWLYEQHTRVKHELLEKYLGGWLPILGSVHNRLVIVDGFAGRGEYEDGSPGSPLIILRTAQELITAGKVKQVVCGFVERDSDNYANLVSVLNRVRNEYPDVKISGPENFEFEAVANKVIDRVGDRMAPSFWFVDPFGFTGVSFATIERIMSMNRSEVFITLMVRDIGRFLRRDDLDDTFGRLFGTGEWRDIVGSAVAGGQKERRLRDLYVARLRSIGCEVTVFRVSMDEKLHTL